MFVSTCAFHTLYIPRYNNMSPESLHTTFQVRVEIMRSQAGVFLTLPVISVVLYCFVNFASFVFQYPLCCYPSLFEILLSSMHTRFRFQEMALP